MASRKHVHFNELIFHSDTGITYLGTEDELDDSVASDEEEDLNKEVQRWSLTEGMPPSLPIRTKSPSISGGRRVLSREGCLDSSSLCESSASSNTPIEASLNGDMCKIPITDIARLPNLFSVDGDNCAPADGSERSFRSLLQDSDHWSPLRSDDFNDYSPPTLPKRRDSGDHFGGKEEPITPSTVPDDDDEDDDDDDCISLCNDYEEIPPPPFDN